MGIRNFLSRLRGRGEQRVCPPTWLPGVIQALLGGGKSSSGITITESKALTYTAYYAAVDLLGRSVGTLPLHVLERGEGEAKNKATAHPNYSLLHTRPNAEQTSFVWRQSMQGWILTWGNAYAEIQRNGAGRPMAIWPIPPNQISVERDKSNQLVYKQTDEKGQTVAAWDAYDILHIHGLGDGLVGWSPVKLFREPIGLALAAEQYGSAFFGNDARPGGILRHPGQLGDKALKNLRDGWEDIHAGPANAARPAILEEGMEWQQVGIPNDDAQFLESRKFQVDEIARIFHIPPHMLGDLDRATFSNIEHSAIEFVQYCLQPWLTAWEQELDYKLFSVAERKRYYTKFNAAGLLRGDAAARSTYYASQWNIGAMSQNEIRALEDRNPIEGGDQHFVPANMIPAEMAGQQFKDDGGGDDVARALVLFADRMAADPGKDGRNGIDGKDGRDGEDGGDGADGAPGHDGKDGKQGDKGEDGSFIPPEYVQATHRAVLVDLCGKVVTKEATALRRAVKKPETFTASLDAFYKDHASHVVHVLRSVVAACAAAMNVSCDGYIKRFADEYVQRANGRLFGQSESRVPALLDEWEAIAPEQMADKILADLRKHT